MTFTKKCGKVVAVTAFLMIALGAASAAGQDSRPDKRPFTIGAILPLSGPYASLGVPSKDAIEFALGELPPDQRLRVRVVY